jgi:hypothetical protein
LILQLFKEVEKRKKSAQKFFLTGKTNCANIIALKYIFTR